MRRPPLPSRPGACSSRGSLSGAPKRSWPVMISSSPVVRLGVVAAVLQLDVEAEIELLRVKGRGCPIDADLLADPSGIFRPVGSRARGATLSSSAGAGGLWTARTARTCRRYTLTRPLALRCDAASERRSQRVVRDSPEWAVPRAGRARSGAAPPGSLLQGDGWRPVLCTHPAQDPVHARDCTTLMEPRRPPRQMECPLLIRVSSPPEDDDDYPDMVLAGAPEEVGAWVRAL